MKMTERYQDNIVYQDTFINIIKSTLNFSLTIHKILHQYH